MYNEVASLIAMTTTISAAGDSIETPETTKEIFCRVVTADYRERSLAASRGLQADKTLILADTIDYNGEDFVDYMGQRYKVTDSREGDTNNELRLVLTKWQTD